MIENVDFPALMLDYAGIALPESMQGRSFRSICETGREPENWKQAVYYRYWMHMAHNLAVPAHFGLRTDRYKLIFFYGTTPDGKNPTPVAWEVYDLTQDPQEMQNKYEDPKYATKIAELKEELQKKRQKLRETDDNFPAVQGIIDIHWN